MDGIRYMLVCPACGSIKDVINLFALQTCGVCLAQFLPCHKPKEVNREGVLTTKITRESQIRGAQVI